MLVLSTIMFTILGAAEFSNEQIKYQCQNIHSGIYNYFQRLFLSMYRGFTLFRYVVFIDILYNWCNIEFCFTIFYIFRYNFVYQF